MFRKAMRDLRWTLVWYATGLLVYAVLIISIFPMFRDMMGEFEQVLEFYPEAVLRAFGLEGELATFSTFVGVEFINVIWPLIVAIFVIMAGTSAVAQEIERGTADLWLSVPEHRWRLLAAKAAALALAVMVLVMVSLGTLGIGALVIGETLGALSLIAAGVVMLSYPLVVLGYSLFLSSLFSERGKAAGIAAGLTILGYLGWLIAELSDRWEWLRYVSPFTAYDPQRALDTGEIPWSGVALLIALALVFVSASLIVFQRRDIATV
jgi:ABC-2 type transport system permease protein